MGEETHNPKKAVPQAMFWSIVANAVLGFLMLITIGVSLIHYQIISSRQLISTSADLYALGRYSP